MVSDWVLLQASLAMGIVCVAIKVLPVVFCKKPIKNQFLSSFLKYVPFAVLTSMTIPEVFNSTSHLASAVAGVIIGVILSICGQGLLVVSLAATVVVFIVERFLGL